MVQANPDEPVKLVTSVGISRRDFVGGALAAGLGLAITELAGCAPEDDEGDVSGGDSNPGPTPDNSPTPESPDDITTDGTNDQGLSTSENATSAVFVVNHTDGTDDGVSRLIELMGSNKLDFYRTAATPRGLIAAADVVIIKVNCQWAERGGTNSDLLERLVEAIAAHPDGFSGEVVVADNGQGQYGTNGRGGSLSWGAANSADRSRSASDVIEALKPRLKVSGSLWDSFTMNQVGEFSSGDMADGFVVEDSRRPTGIVLSYPKFTSEYGTHISFRQGVWDAAANRYDSSRLKVINLPVLKVHSGYQATGAVKAYMGTTASRLTGQASHNSVGTGGMGTQLAYTRLPVLNIMDMIWVGVLRGPNTGYKDAMQKNMLAASTDAVALDWWCVRNVLMPLVEEKGRNAGNLDPDADGRGTFGHWLGLAAAELQAAGFAANRGSAVSVFEA